MRSVPLFSLVFCLLTAAVTAGDEKAPQPTKEAPQASKDSYVKVRVDVEIRGTLSHTGQATTVTARSRAFSAFDDTKEVPDAAWTTAYTLDFAEAKDFRELAKALAGREVVVTGKSELRLVVPPPSPPGGSGGGAVSLYQPPTWSLQRTILVTGLKSAGK